VIIFSLIKKNGFWKINNFDLFCGFFSILALIIYIITNKLSVSILFAIISDGLASFPTIIKSLKFPETESPVIYTGGIMNNILALLIIKNWTFSIYSFSIYFIVINVIIIFSIYYKKMLRCTIYRA
jgi:hypothetical protein